MAITTKGTKSRLDFGAALESAVFKKSEDPGAAIETSNIAEHNHSSNHPATEEPILEDDTRVVEGIVDQDTSKPEVRKEPSKMEKQEEDIFRSISKSGRGVQSTVYFENEVYHYIKDKAERYNAKFSNVVNLLLKEVINKEQ